MSRESLEILKGRHGWRWRFRVGARVVALGAAPYATKAGAMRAFRAARRALAAFGFYGIVRK